VTYEQILTEVHDEILVITLNRPEKLNAWTDQMRRELVAAIDDANEDADIGAIVLTGQGRGFCAGADIGQNFEARIEGTRESRAEDRRDWVAFVRESKPLIAAVNGVAVGVGLTMILPFDIILASDRARFGMFFVRMGLVPELASSNLAVQRVGFAKASEMCLTGKLYEASEVADTGLVNRVVPHDELLPAALAMGRDIAANPAPSLRMIKSLLTRNANCDDLATVQAREVEALQAAYVTPEHKEAVAAFLEKRKPDFKKAAEQASA
jgi:2-(1,2-epoxy-1,2-dihydrophenyl)acetyl-CoA isomerase